MSKEQQIALNAECPSDLFQPAFSQVGDKNIQVGHATNINNVINIIVPAVSRSTNNPVINTEVRLNTNYYNLFVIGEETFDGEYFIVPKERALTESITPEIFEQFSGLSRDAIAQIKSFPSLFASENRSYGRTDNDHKAYYGIVTDVKSQANGIKIYFRVLSELPQQYLNEIALNLAFGRASIINELNRTHWAIKKINLVKELSAAGIHVIG